ncbi:hypothetical protein [Nocardia aurantia]|uniref:Uncharacterized protein n=1 Tax=Nocardia aurantia TaxID=2585199 RepID=A0A7K0DSY8_9NOCA|nr:hypothetical protein [Nocardia aurantia]MQY28879.1 hypothetical protein [Nocardia aurantia]
MAARVSELRYRLAIVAPTPAAVVEYLGGWVFDQVLAGWDTTVFVPTAADPRPLSILGAELAELPCDAPPPAPEARPHAVAVATELFEIDPRVHKSALATLTSGRSDLTFWGPGRPAELGAVLAQRDFVPSLAARAFKARALAAAGLDRSAGAAERRYTKPPAVGRRSIRRSALPPDSRASQSC